VWTPPFFLCEQLLFGAFRLELEFWNQTPYLVRRHWVREMLLQALVVLGGGAAGEEGVGGGLWRRPWFLSFGFCAMVNYKLFFTGYTENSRRI
jgi:hypothetical protein